MKVALVTGGSRGLGHALVQVLLLRGYRVHVLDLLPYPDPGGMLEDVIHHPVDLEQLDVAALPDLPQLDLVICNAGITAVGDFKDMPDEGDRRIIEVNLLGHMALIKELLRRDGLRPKGRLAFTNSAAVYVPWPVGIAYAASKSALNGFALALESYLSPQGISVTRIYPGAMRTEHGGYAQSQGVQVGVPPERIAPRIVRGILARRRRLFPDRMGLVLSLASTLFPRTLSRLIRGKLDLAAASQAADQR